MLLQGKKFTLGSKNQPEIVHNWLKRRCDLNNMPDITNFIDRFGDSWQLWYAGLQPKWHPHDNNGRGTLIQDAPDNAQLSDWSEIRKGSQNRNFLFFLTLGWWAVGASDQGDEAVKKWADAFDNFRWVLELLLNEESEEETRMPDKCTDARDPCPLSKR